MFTNALIGRLAMTVGMAGSALALGSASPAPIPVSGSSGDSAWVAVRTGDLNLSTADGAREMMARLHHAARQVCGPEPSDRLSFGRQDDACMHEVVNSAVINLGSPTVAALNGRSAPVAADADGR
jgi:UrcA family protein